MKKWLKGLLVLGSLCHGFGTVLVSAENKVSLEEFIENASQLDEKEKIAEEGRLWSTFNVDIPEEGELKGTANVGGAIIFDPNQLELTQLAGMLDCQVSGSLLDQMFPEADETDEHLVYNIYVKDQIGYVKENDTWHVEAIEDDMDEMAKDIKEFLANRHQYLPKINSDWLPFIETYFDYTNDGNQARIVLKKDRDDQQLLNDLKPLIDYDKLIKDGLDQYLADQASLDGSNNAAEASELYKEMVDRVLVYIIDRVNDFQMTFDAKTYRLLSVNSDFKFEDDSLRQLFAEVIQASMEAEERLSGSSGSSSQGETEASGLAAVERQMEMIRAMIPEININLQAGYEALATGDDVKIELPSDAPTYDPDAESSSDMETSSENESVFESE